MKIIACISQDWKLVPAAETPMDDKQRFAALTAGGHCIVGRKTWDELPEAMKNRSASRFYTVLTRTVTGDKFGPHGEERVPQLSAYLHTPPWVIGGMEIYRLLWHRATFLYLSVLHRDAGTQPFPQLGTETWERIVNQHHESHVFQIYRRR